MRDIEMNVSMGDAAPDAHLHPFVTFLLHTTAVILLVILVLRAAVMAYKLSARKTEFRYVPFSSGLKDVVITDSTHRGPEPTLTHHKGHNNPSGLRASDTSTGIVLNALTSNFLFGGEAYSYCQTAQITTNHFDVDSFLSVWCYLNREIALQNDSVLRHMARIGDFREAFLSPDMVAQYGREDGVGNIREAFTALKLVCWLNALEIRLFSAAYETKDCQQKMEYFLPLFATVLQDPESEWSVWDPEYKQVIFGFEQLAAAADGYSVEYTDRTGLTIITAPEPLHYYSLFSHTHGYDTVLTMYDRNRYEVECKYTQFVSVHSRPVWPRLDMTPLANVLNTLEQGQASGLYWTASHFTDPGPLLRLERVGQPLTKAQRYGHPFARPMESSSIQPPVMSAIVQSFMEFGMQDMYPKRGGFSWDELHSLNHSIPWATWSNAVMDQHDRGELNASIACLSSPQGQASPTHPFRAASMDVGVPLELAPSPPQLSEPSRIVVAVDDLRALAGTLPPRFALGKWQLLYSTDRDGISLSTLYRKAAGHSPTLLVVKDTGGYIMGAVATEPWKIHPRFYGTGETSVFQLYPRRLLFPWCRLAAGDHSNDFFQFSTHEGLGVGGAGHFALWLDNDLYEGSSNSCLTFGSPCLASQYDFHVHSVELWQIL